MYLYTFTKNSLLFVSDKDIPTEETFGNYFHYIVTKLSDKPYHQVYIKHRDNDLTINGYDSYPQEDSINIKYDLKVTPYKNITEYYTYKTEFTLIYRKYIFSKEDVNKYNDLLAFHILYGMTYYAKDVYILPTISSILNHHPSEFSTKNHPYTFDKNKNIIKSFGKDKAFKIFKLITHHTGLLIILKSRYKQIFKDTDPSETPSRRPDRRNYRKIISSYLKHFFGIDDNFQTDARRYFILMFAENLKNNPQVIASSYFVKNDNLDSLICKFNKLDPTRCDIPQHVKDYIGDIRISAFERETIIRLNKQGLLDDFIKDIRQSSIEVVKRIYYIPHFMETLYSIFNKRLNLKDKLKSYMNKRWNYEILCDVFEGLDMPSIKELASLYDIDTNLTRIQICTELSKILDRKKEEYKRIVSDCSNSDDPISGNEVKNIDPREAITIEQDGKQFCFEIEGLYGYIKKNKTNPYTRVPFSDDQLKTIENEYAKFRKLRGPKFNEDTYKYETSLHALTVKFINFLPYTSGVEKFINASDDKIQKFLKLLNYLEIDVKVDMNNPKTSLDSKKRVLLEQLIKYVIKYGYFHIRMAWLKVFTDKQDFDPIGDNKLLKAIINKDTQSITKYINENVNLNEVYPAVGEPLYVAIKVGFLPVIKLLVQSGATIKYNYYETILVHKNIRDYLISQGILLEHDFIEINDMLYGF